MPATLGPYVLDMIARIGAQASVPEVWRTYLDAARAAGLTFGMATFLPRDRSLDAMVFADSFPSGWLANYVANGYQPADPLMARNMTAVRPFDWSLSEWDDAELPLRRRWRDDNRATGLLAGFTIPDRSSGDFKLISLCGLHADLDPKDRAALHFAGLEALNRMHDLGVRPRGPAGPSLTARERECLQWITAGKSDWEIGCILSISEKTVNTHVEHAKHKLGATTRAQAVVLALRCGAVTL